MAVFNFLEDVDPGNILVEMDGEFARVLGANILEHQCTNTAIRALAYKMRDGRFPSLEEDDEDSSFYLYPLKLRMRLALARTMADFLLYAHPKNKALLAFAFRLREESQEQETESPISHGLE